MHTQGNQVVGGLLLIGGLVLWLVGMSYNAGVTLLATVAIGVWLYYSSPSGRTRR